MSITGVGFVFTSECEWGGLEGEGGGEIFIFIFIFIFILFFLAGGCAMCLRMGSVGYVSGRWVVDRYIRGERVGSEEQIVVSYCIELRVCELVTVGSEGGENLRGGD